MWPPWEEDQIKMFGDTTPTFSPARLRGAVVREEFPWSSVVLPITDP